MNWLVVGSGTREYAIARRLRSENHRVVSYGTRPNYGLAEICANAILSTTYASNEIIAAATNHDIDIILIGQEEAIFDGLADKAHEAGIGCYAPRKQLARLEADKAYAKQLASKLKF